MRHLATISKNVLHRTRNSQQLIAEHAGYISVEVKIIGFLKLNASAANSFERMNSKFDVKNYFLNESSTETLSPATSSLMLEHFKK